MMTKEEIFSLAEKADLYLASDDSIIKFANLIAEKEREECAEAVEGYRKQRTHETWYKAEDQIRARGQDAKTKE